MSDQVFLSMMCFASLFSLPVSVQQKLIAGSLSLLIEMMLFMVAGKFSCEIESAGNVHVRGLTTGGKTIRKPSRVFEMKFQQLCPPGPFTLSFTLPGPVDPRLFAPNFRSDGIFEGVIIKHTKK